MNSPFQTEINVSGVWDNMVWANIGGATNKDFNIGAGVFVKSIGFGYSYEMNSKPISTLSGGSHEIMIQYCTNSGKKRAPYFKESRQRYFRNNRK